MTQEDLASRAGTSTKTVSEIERGVANPTLDLIERLAGALKIDLHELLLVEPDEEGLPKSLTAGVLADRIAGYLANRPRKDVVRALRVLEILLADE